ncbi:unnamed protein product, partial [Phaeothamnion confervicola]
MSATKRNAEASLKRESESRGEGGNETSPTTQFTQEFESGARRAPPAEAVAFGTARARSGSSARREDEGARSQDDEPPLPSSRWLSDAVTGSEHRRGARGPPRQQGAAAGSSFADPQRASQGYGQPRGASSFAGYGAGQQ